MLANAAMELRFWKLAAPMPALARNADGDTLLFVHAGRGDLFCDFGHLAFEAGDYLYLPRGTMWRLSPEHPAAFLRPDLARRDIILNEALRRRVSSERVTVSGLIIIRQRPGTAKGSRPARCRRRARSG